MTLPTMPIPVVSPKQSFWPLSPSAEEDYAVPCICSGVLQQPELSVYAIIPTVMDFYEPVLEINTPATSRL
jgi:hypothetical protein